MGCETKGSAWAATRLKVEATDASVSLSTATCPASAGHSSSATVRAALASVAETQHASCPDAARSGRPVTGHEA